jgi:hypothetical protein
VISRQNEEYIEPTTGLLAIRATVGGLLGSILGSLRGDVAVLLRMQLAARSFNSFDSGLLYPKMLEISRGQIWIFAEADMCAKGVSPEIIFAFGRIRE